MKFRSILSFSVIASAALAQVPTISIAPRAPSEPSPTAKLASTQERSTPEKKRVPTAGAAVLGYLLGPGPAERLWLERRRAGLAAL